MLPERLVKREVEGSSKFQPTMTPYMWLPLLRRTSSCGQPSVHTHSSSAIHRTPVALCAIYRLHGMESPNCRRINELNNLIIALQHMQLSHIGKCLPQSTSLQKQNRSRQFLIFKTPVWRKSLNDPYCCFLFLLVLKRNRKKSLLEVHQFYYVGWKTRKNRLYLLKNH